MKKNKNQMKCQKKKMNKKYLILLRNIKIKKSNNNNYQKN